MKNSSEFINKIENFFNKWWSNNQLLKIILIYDITIVLGSILFYYLIPTLLNYPPDNAEIYKRMGIIPYLTQFIILDIFIILISDFFLVISLRDLNYWEKWANLDDEKSHTKIKKIREKCLSLPYRIYTVQIVFVVLIVALFQIPLAIISQASYYYILKLLIVLFSFFSLVGIVSFIFSKQVFTFILLKTFSEQYENNLKTKFSIQQKIFLQILPMILSAILFTALIGLIFPR